MKSTEQIGLRVSEELNKKLDNKAKEMCISKNALMLVLIDIGLKTYEGIGTVQNITLHCLKE